jgi:hypothetical protein
MRWINWAVLRTGSLMISARPPSDADTPRVTLGPAMTGMALLSYAANAIGSPF